MPRFHYSFPQEMRGWSNGPARRRMHRQVAVPPPSHLRDYVASMVRLALTLLLGTAALIVLRLLTS
jgi:hypothetical protein